MSEQEQVTNEICDIVKKSGINADWSVLYSEDRYLMVTIAIGELKLIGITFSVIATKREFGGFSYNFIIMKQNNQVATISGCNDWYHTSKLIVSELRDAVIRFPHIREEKIQL